MGNREGRAELAELVRALRTVRGLSQNALSKAAGLAPSYVNQLETGARGKRPGRDQVLALASALRASPKERADLLRAAGLEDGSAPGRPTFEQFVNSDGLLRSDQKRALIGIYGTMVREAASDRR